MILSFILFCLGLALAWFLFAKWQLSKVQLAELPTYGDHPDAKIISRKPRTEERQIAIYSRSKGLAFGGELRQRVS